MMQPRRRTDSLRVVNAVRHTGNRKYGKRRNRQRHTQVELVAQGPQTVKLMSWFRILPLLDSLVTVKVKCLDP